MSQRKIITFDNISADGYFTDANDKLDWVMQSPEVTQAAMGSAPSVDVMLFGRTTFEMFELGWRDKNDDPHGGGKTDASRQMSSWINDHRKVVFSTTMKEPTWKKSELRRTVDRPTIEALKREASGDLIVFGSGKLVVHLTELGLIDEYIFIVSPIFLGEGRSLLGGLSERTKLALRQQRAFEKTGHVLLSYGRG